MMHEAIKKKMAEAVWIGASLFNRGKTSGSSANMSFRHEDYIYITGSGTCFGTLTEESFAVIDRKGNHVSGLKPSKEYPLHLKLYEKSEEIEAVIHTHSFYATLWSCLEHEKEADCIPSYTPYLKMKLGTVGLIPYHKPGSHELFAAFGERIMNSDGYLLKNHGPVVGDLDLMAAFYALEELEESCRVAWELRKELGKRVLP
ncbi:MAG: class II aldolase/adducin family protein [Lachnospiraceae bacterium]